jgi:hypothetical protein
MTMLAYKQDGSPFDGITTGFININLPVATVSIQIVGTLSAGSYTLEASLDGVTFQTIKMANNLSTLATTIAAPGIYRADINGFQCAHLVPSSPVGTHQVYIFGTTVPLGFVPV